MVCMSTSNGNITDQACIGDSPCSGNSLEPSLRVCNQHSAARVRVLTATPHEPSGNALVVLTREHVLIASSPSQHMIQFECGQHFGAGRVVESPQPLHLRPR